MTLRVGVGTSATAAIMIAVLAVPAFGIRGERAAPPIEFSQSHRLAAVETRSRANASLWEAPTADGGRCVFLLVAQNPGAVPSRGRTGSGACAPKGAVQRAPIEAYVNWIAAPNGQFEVLVDGSLADGSGIRRLELRSSSISVPLALRDRHFLVELPAVESATSLGPGANVLIGYDSRGSEVARLDLNALIDSVTAP